MSLTSTKDFSRLRSFIWPVKRSELKTFIPTILMFLIICFIYNLLRGMKDSLVLTAPSSGAEALPFLKVWAILPSALLVTFLFTRVSNHLSKENVFYAMMALFLGFFFIFAFVLFPNRDYLHPHEYADKLQISLPMGFKGLIAIFRNWTFTLFYIMAEMWSTIIMTVLFWGFANDVTSVQDAKRFYPLLGIAANMSGIFAGESSTWMSQHIYNPMLPFGETAWDQAVVLLNLLIIFGGLICIGCYKWLHVNGYGYNSETFTKHRSKEKIKMGLRKNFAYLAKSKYLICIAVIVLTYNISINLIEVVWKDQIRQLYPHPRDLFAYMGQVQTVTGIVATITAIFISGNILRHFSWTTASLISPAIILCTGIGFFSFLLFKDYGLGTIATYLGSTPLAIGVFFGSLQNVLARASKYTLFDSTKELAFIPLSEECKLKGKAAIDGIGSRLGKSGGSVIHQGLLVMIGTVAASTPYVASILFLTIGAWIVATKSLGKQFNELTARHQTIDIKEETEEKSSSQDATPVTT